MSLMKEREDLERLYLETDRAGKAVAAADRRYFPITLMALMAAVVAYLVTVTTGQTWARVATFVLIAVGIGFALRQHLAVRPLRREYYRVLQAQREEYYRLYPTTGQKFTGREQSTVTKVITIAIWVCAVVGVLATIANWIWA